MLGEFLATMPQSNIYLPKLASAMQSLRGASSVDSLLQAVMLVGEARPLFCNGATQQLAVACRTRLVAVGKSMQGFDGQDIDNVAPKLAEALEAALDLWPDAVDLEGLLEWCRRVARRAAGMSKLVNLKGRHGERGKRRRTDTSGHVQDRRGREGVLRHRRRRRRPHLVDRRLRRARHGCG